MNRHKWGSKYVHGIASACSICGAVKEYIKGVGITYFINDVVSTSSPNCDPENRREEDLTGVSNPRFVSHYD